jgi:dihydroorotate dehydrogenase
MYKVIFRPLLFLLPPEIIHEILVGSVKFFHRLPLVPWLLRKIYCMESPLLTKDFLGLKFKNPVGLSAGFDKNAEFFNEFSSFGFGFIEIGTITPRAQPGNPKPRSFRLPKDKALINRMGLNNLGVDEVVNKLKNRNRYLIIGGNIGKNTDTPDEKAVDDFVYCFEKLYDYVDYFVINISCPNTGEIDKLQDQEVMEGILGEIAGRRALKTLKKPILLKISPDLNNNQIDVALSIIQKLNIDGVVATNTTVKRDGLLTDKRIVDAIANGGLSGAPLRDRSNEVIRYISLKTGGNLPIIGVGGIMTVSDAHEKLMAGAGLIQVYTGFIYEGPMFARRILQSLIKQ